MYNLPMNKILVTDSLFILPEHVRQLEAAGYEVERLDKLKATEAELIAAVKGKVGYILGGIEHVTQPVIDAADSLKVITFTGIGYKGLIPSWEYATQKGIAITNTPDAPTQAVAEWSITAALAMNRCFFDLGLAGEKDFLTTPGLQDQKIGIIGLGRIGARIADMLGPFKVASISYYSPHHKAESETDGRIKYASLDEVLATSDIVFVCVGDDAGKNYINAEHLSRMRDGALIVSFMHPGIIDAGALFVELKSGRLRAVSDYPEDARLKELPFSTWYSFNGSNAFNTHSGIAVASRVGVQSMINVLKTGDDANVVNPEYRQHLR